jgi:hypothetical protein
LEGFWDWAVETFAARWGVGRASLRAAVAALPPELREVVAGRYW